MKSNEIKTSKKAWQWIKNIWITREKDEENNRLFELFFSIPVLTIFIYSFTVLVQVGENSYFNIPSSFVDTSVASVVVYGDFLIRSILAVTHGGWIVWTMVFILVVISILLFGLRSWYKAIAFAMMITFLYFSPKIGSLIAETENHFYVPGNDCQNIPQGTNIAVDFYNDKVVFISIDQGTSSAKISNEFFVRDVSSLNCKMKWKRTGKIEKQ
jgi:hypothetical protein